MLARNRDSIAISIICLIVYAVLGNTSAPYLGSAGTIIFLFVIAEEFLRREAIKESRLARELHDQRVGRFIGRIRRFILFSIAISIVIDQNFMNIGTAITGSLPFMNKAAELLLHYINGIVEDFYHIWKNLPMF